MDACYAFIKWGANTKVKKLIKDFPRILEKLYVDHLLDSDFLNNTTSSSTGSFHLDFLSILKSAQIISGEINLEKLLKKLIDVVIENAGAERGILVLEKEGELFIEAEGQVDNVTTIETILLNDEHKVSSSIINYVARTHESVVLKDANTDEIFINDNYILKYQPKSILCIPIINKRKLIGVLYLENNLTTGAFTPDRIEVLKLLSLF